MVIFFFLTDKTEAINADVFIRDTAERWKSMSMELYCVESMLEEVVTYWKRWKELSAELEKWIEFSSSKLSLPEDDKMDYFQVMNVLYLFL